MLSVKTPTRGEWVMKTRELTLGALLAAMAILIPAAFAGILTITIPPFTATLMSHVPVFLAMLINPMVAALVGVASAIGFFIKLGLPYVAARALMHAVVGYMGAVMIKKGRSFQTALTATMPVHAILEGLVVIPFIGFDFHKVIVVVAIGTAIHHGIDSVISFAFAKALRLDKYFRAIGIHGTN